MVSYHDEIRKILQSYVSIADLSAEAAWGTSALSKRGATEGGVSKTTMKLAVSYTHIRLESGLFRRRRVGHQCPL
jgi:hypothetical protein